MWEPEFLQNLLAECIFPVVNLGDLGVVKKPVISKQDQIHVLIRYDQYFDFFLFARFSLWLLWRSLLNMDCGNKPQSLCTSGHTTPQTCSTCSQSPSQGEVVFWDDVDACRSRVTQVSSIYERAQTFIAESIQKLSSVKVQNLWKPHAVGVLKMLIEHPQSLKVA